MTLQRIRSTVAGSLLAVLVVLTAAMPAPGGAPPLVDAPRLTAAADGVRVIVSGSLSAIEASVAEFGGEVLARMPVLGAVIADVPPESVDRLQGAPGVTAVTADGAVELEGTTDGDVHPADATGPQTLGVEHVWRKGYDGSGVGIAVIDTGVSEIADLDGRVREGIDLTAEADGVDRYGHGTPIAWLAAGDGTASDGEWTGVAPGAHIIPVKIADAEGRTEIARLLIALDWVARHADSHDIDVVNLSLGSAPAAVDLVDAAVQRLWDLGLVVVVAAGNNGPDSLGTPAGNTHVITVGSSLGRNTKQTRDDVAASWSSTGVDTDGTLKPDLTAPGQSLVVAGAPGSWGYEGHPEGHLGNGYQRVSGTSFSAGLISGAAALALDVHPNWTPDEVLGQLLADSQTIDGTHAPTPNLAKGLRTDDPDMANGEATAANVGASAPGTEVLLELGPPEAFVLTGAIGGDALRAITLGTGWYGTGWYGTGWYGTGWYGTGWYGTGWYGTGWYDLDWNSTDWYGTGWYGTGWYGTGWYGTGWYGTGWYGTGWYGTGWY